MSYTAGVAITLHRIQHTYMMVARMADNILDGSEGLLVDGCAQEDIIDRDSASE